MQDWTPAETGPAPLFGPLPVPQEGKVTPPLPFAAVPPAAGAAAWKPLELPPDISGSGLHVGTGGYRFDDWAGRFYPPARGNSKVSSREWYPFYQLYFSFLEIGHTFHEEPLIAQFAELERRSRPGMMFSVKTHRDISHKGTWDVREGRSLMLKHVAAVSPLAETGRFYSFLIQLDEGLERGRKPLDYLLATASAAVSEGLDVHIEFRHRSWHQESVLQSLKDAGVGFCNTDLPDLPHAFPLKTYATTGKAYVRYCGRNLAAWRAAEEIRKGRGSPVERLRALNARYDYLYSTAEMEDRVRGQLLLLKKSWAVAAVFKNHVGAKAALNALQNIHLLRRGLSGPSG